MFLLLASTTMESGGEIVPVHNSVDTLDAAAAAIETVNAAAAAILTAGNRRQHDVLPVCASTPYCMFLFLINIRDVLHGFWLDHLCINDCVAETA